MSAVTAEPALIAAKPRGAQLRRFARRNPTIVAGGVIYVQGSSFEPAAEDVLIAVATGPAAGATPAATNTSEPLVTVNGALYKGDLQRTGQYKAAGVSTLAGERRAGRVRRDAPRDGAGHSHTPSITCAASSYPALQAFLALRITRWLGHR